MELVTPDFLNFANAKLKALFTLTSTVKRREKLTRKAQRFIVFFWYLKNSAIVFVAYNDKWQLFTQKKYVSQKRTNDVIRTKALNCFLQGKTVWKWTTCNEFTFVFEKFLVQRKIFFIIFRVYLMEESLHHTDKELFKNAL